MTPPLDWVWPLPQDVRHALAGQGDAELPRAQLRSVKNPGLLLHKYVPYPWQGRGDNWDWKCTYTLPNGRRRETSKTDGWLQVMPALSEACKDRRGVAPAVEQAEKRLDACCTALASLGYTMESKVFKVCWRLVIGLGLPSPFETGLALHHLYGVPVIPGSALKGLTRAWRLQTIAEDLGVPQLEPVHTNKWNDTKLGLTPLQRLEELLSTSVPRPEDDNTKRKAKEARLEERYGSLLQGLEASQKNKLEEWGYEVPSLGSRDERINEYIDSFSRVFGSVDREGEVIFLDALPKSLVVDGEPLLELDLMNPHYGKYYEGTSPPSDSLTPVPVPFLAVRKDSRFQLRILSQEGALLDEASKWLTRALDELGIGAKTRAGYGQIVPPGAEKAGTGTAASATGSAQRDTSLEMAVQGYMGKQVGMVKGWVDRIAQQDDPDYRLELAQILQQRLAASKQWGGKYAEKGWHRTLASLLGQDADAQKGG